MFLVLSMSISLNFCLALHLVVLPFYSATFYRSCSLQLSPFAFCNRHSKKGTLIDEPLEKNKEEQKNLCQLEASLTPDLGPKRINWTLDRWMSRSLVLVAARVQVHATPLFSVSAPRTRE
ncbi:hypothetical protein V8C43DRAFT_295131 [Trichoderma afarasin]